MVLVMTIISMVATVAAVVTISRVDEEGSDSTIWVTADHHFGHENVIAYDSRPFNSIDEMNKTLIERWNEVVKPDDYVYHLGDFALCSRAQEEAIFKALNGHKVIIRGNHDRGPDALNEIGWDWVSNGPVVLYREPGVYEDFIVTYPSHVLLTHYPDISMNSIGDASQYQMINVAVNCWDYYPIPMPVPREWTVLHGHTHNGKVVGRYVDRVVRT
jgi:calcineurin-like phosphoesterase family protein